MHHMHAYINYKTRRVKFQVHNESILEWKGNILVFKGTFISYGKAGRMFSKGAYIMFSMLRMLSSRFLLLIRSLLLMNYLISLLVTNIVFLPKGKLTLALIFYPILNLFLYVYIIWPQ